LVGLIGYATRIVYRGAVLGKEREPKPIIWVEYHGLNMGACIRDTQPNNEIRNEQRNRKTKDVDHGYIYSVSSPTRAGLRFKQSNFHTPSTRLFEAKLR
jgi:hypothetical protein